MMCGGHSDLKAVDDEAKAVLNEVFEELKAHLKKECTVDQFALEGYTTQVVAGKKYTLHVDHQGSHMKIICCRGLPHTGGKVNLMEVIWMS